MKTVTADQESRIKIPHVRPNEEFTYDASSSGVITLTPVKENTEVRFPPGSLTSYITEDNDQEMLQILTNT